MDTITKDKRHKIMASIRSKDTKPEIIVRKFLWHNGFRYRLNNPRLPGHLDIVLRKYRTCIFVNGCFWHGHENCKLFRLPKSNVNYWTKKINRNRERDKEEQKKLVSLAFTLNHIFLQEHSIAYPHVEEESELDMAAEPLSDNK